jgi:hypothetical protein
MTPFQLTMNPIHSLKNTLNPFKMAKGRQLQLRFRLPESSPWAACGGAGLRRKTLWFETTSAMINQHLFSLTLGTTRQGKSTLSQALMPTAPEPLLREAAVDALMDIQTWNVGADEALGPTHPAIGLAFFYAIEQAFPDSREFHQVALLLGAALAGQPLPESPDSAWLDGIETSAWANKNSHFFEHAQIIAHSLSERAALSENLSPTPKASGAARL